LEWKFTQKDYIEQLAPSHKLGYHPAEISFEQRRYSIPLPSRVRGALRARYGDMRRCRNSLAIYDYAT